MVSVHYPSWHPTTTAISSASRVLDCLGFMRHYLHLFHRRRVAFLDVYQKLVLDQPDSAVGLPLKEVILALRRAAIEPDA